MSRLIVPATPFDLGDDDHPHEECGVFGIIGDAVDPERSRPAGGEFVQREAGLRLNEDPVVDVKDRCWTRPLL